MYAIRSYYAVALYVKSNDQQVTAQIGGVSVDVQGLGSQPGNRIRSDLAWSSIALTPAMAGQPIRLTFSNTGTKPVVEVYTRITSYNVCYTKLLRDCGVCCAERGRRARSRQRVSRRAGSRRAPCTPGCCHVDKDTVMYA